MLFPQLNEVATQRMYCEEFMGYNHNLRIQDGQFYDMKNLSSDAYPLLTTRKKRGSVFQMTKPHGIVAKDALAWVDGTDLYYNNEKIEGIVLTDTDKTMIGMGAYLVIWPDKFYINTEDLTEYGYLENSWSNAAGISVTFSICRPDGEAYNVKTTGKTAPESPENGDIWLDTSGSTHVLKIYAANSSMWSQVATVYTKISANGIGQGFKTGDGVYIAGCEATGEQVSDELKKQVKELNGSKLLFDKGDNYIVVIGLLDQTYTQTTVNAGELTVKRRVPAMDYITEAGNRLWGCKYGVVDGKVVNEIYCCKLGDFKNWECYQGVSTDSYAASVGSDGVWTGAITHMGYPLFFKENCVHKVYPSNTGAHQIVETQLRGVQKGSARSLTIVNEVVYYKSPIDICAYDGSLPQSISDAFGGLMYSDAVGGALGDKLYMTMKNTAGVSEMFVLDTENGIWSKEDGIKASGFAKKGQDLYYIDADTKKLMSITGQQGSLEDDFEWFAETGNIGYSYPDNKYISRFNIRINLETFATVGVSIQYDSDGVWQLKGRMTGKGIKTFTLPVPPRRCDHMKIKLEGKGGMTLYSIAKILEIGSDIK